MDHVMPSAIAPCLFIVPFSDYLASSPCLLCCCLQGGPWKVTTHAPLSFLESINDLGSFYASLALLLDIKALEYDSKFLCFSGEKSQA